MPAPGCARCAGVGCGDRSGGSWSCRSPPCGRRAVIDAVLRLAFGPAAHAGSGLTPPVRPHPTPARLRRATPRGGDGRPGAGDQRPGEARGRGLGLSSGSQPAHQKPPQVGGHPVTAGADGVPAGWVPTLRGECRRRGGGIEARSDRLVPGRSAGAGRTPPWLRYAAAPLLTRGGWARLLPAASG